MEQESYPLKSCPHPERLVQVNIGSWINFQFFTRLAAVFAEKADCRSLNFFNPPLVCQT